MLVISVQADLEDREDQTSRRECPLAETGQHSCFQILPPSPNNNCQASDVRSLCWENLHAGDFELLNLLISLIYKYTHRKCSLD